MRVDGNSTFGGNTCTISQPDNCATPNKLNLTDQVKPLTLARYLAAASFLRTQEIESLKPQVEGDFFISDIRCQRADQLLCDISKRRAIVEKFGLDNLPSDIPENSSDIEIKDKAETEEQRKIDHSITILIRINQSLYELDSILNDSEAVSKLNAAEHGKVRTVFALLQNEYALHGQFNDRLDAIAYRAAAVEGLWQSADLLYEAVMEHHNRGDRSIGDLGKWLEPVEYMRGQISEHIGLSPVDNPGRFNLEWHESLARYIKSNPEAKKNRSGFCGGDGWTVLCSGEGENTIVPISPLTPDELKIFFRPTVELEEAA